MRIKKIYDGKEDYLLATFQTRAQALSWLQSDAAPKCALFPSLSADVGMLSFSPLWGNTPTPEALRAVSYYLGILCGWPLDAVTVACEKDLVVSLPLCREANAQNVQKLKICKQKFEKTTLFTASVSHEAIRLCEPNAFYMIESDHPNAVDLSVAQSLRTVESPRTDLPICFASLSESLLQLRVCKRGMGELCADDLMYMHALAYFASIGRAAPDRLYEGAGGSYCIRGAFTAESLRTPALQSAADGAVF